MTTARQRAQAAARPILSQALANVPSDVVVALNLGELVDAMFNAADENAIALPRHRVADEDVAAYRVGEKPGDPNRAYYALLGTRSLTGAPEVSIAIVESDSAQNAPHVLAEGGPLLVLSTNPDNARVFGLAIAAAADSAARNDWGAWDEAQQAAAAAQADAEAEASQMFDNQEK